MVSYMLKSEDEDDIPNVTSEGVENLKRLLTSLMDIIEIIENPKASTYSFKYEHDVLTGAAPTEDSFRNIVNKHFNMTVSEFFSAEEIIVKDIFNNFENDCFNEALYICDYDVRTACAHLSFLEYCLGETEKYC